MDKFESLRAFTQVVVAGGFAAAARDMGLSRSAVNKLVLALEQELGVQLLHRSTRVVTPTEAGLAFHARAVEILASLEAAQRAVTQLHEQPTGRLRVNAPMTFGTLHLAPVLAQFTAQYPDLQLQISLSDRLIDPLEEGFDITLRIAQPPPSTSLVVVPLAPAARLVCAAPSYLQQHGIPTRPQDLRQHSCLHYGHLPMPSPWSFLANKTEGSQTIPVQGRLCSNNGEVLKTAAIAGLGITLLPSFMVEPALQQGELQQILADYPLEPLPMSILYPVSRHLSVKVRLLVDFLRTQFGFTGRLF